MNNIQTEITKDLGSAKHSIKVAVSWLTDKLLINELIGASKRGVDVKVIVSSNELNIIRFELFQKLIDLGATVNKEGNEDTEQGDFMHYKFYIIDDKSAKSGSYNWSKNAVTNRETLDDVDVSKKLNEFNECLKASVNFFEDIHNPAQKKAELELIEKEHKDILTPEKLALYRQTQTVIKQEQHKKELDKKEAKAKQAELELIEKEKQNQYGVKQDAPPVSEAPPRSYGNEQE
jgi:phosphatidylserine/phosphatidylglycerophosphate/cardiolipin synthase-like enzyme